MKLRHLPFYFFIILFSCKEPTLIGDKDCAGVIGGKAIVDDCGYCTGGTTKLQFNYFWGCDGECIGSQFDCTYPGDSTCTSNDPPETCVSACNGDYITDCKDDCIHKDDAREFDLCGVCDPCDDGTKYEACANWNSTCEGCTNPNAVCNSFDSAAMVYEEGSCISPSYICETGDDGLLDITTITALTSDNEDCYEPADEYNCGSGESICKIFDCNDPELGLNASQSIPCNPQLTLDGYLVNESDIGNGTCDYNGYIDDVLFNFTSCPEFNYDGGTPEFNFKDGDCELVDCRGVHFSDILCEDEFESYPIIDTLINFPPDSVVIQTSTLITYIGGCTDGSYRDITTTETLYSYNAENSVVTVIDSTLIGLRGWLGDGECDSDSLGDLFKKYGLDFNCIEHDYEGGDCVNATSRNKSHNQNLIKSNNISLLISKREEKIKNILNKQR